MCQHLTLNETRASPPPRGSVSPAEQMRADITARRVARDAQLAAIRGEIINE